MASMPSCLIGPTSNTSLCWPGFLLCVHGFQRNPVPKGEQMSLAWNTRRLMDTSTDRPIGQPVEYHLLSGRALYDAATISPNPFRSSTAEWILRADQDFYSVSVVSRPFDALPQELCVSFPCFTKQTKGKVW